jgi:hypothetical protein
MLRCRRPAITWPCGHSYPTPERIQPDQLRHRCRPWSPGAPQPEHQRADRGQRMTVHGAQIDCTARPAPGAEDVEPRVPATSAARIVGDHSMSRPVASRRFQRSITASASPRAARSALSLAAPALMSSPRVRTPLAPASGRRHPESILPTYGSQSPFGSAAAAFNP